MKNIPISLIVDPWGAYLPVVHGEICEKKFQPFMFETMKITENIKDLTSAFYQRSNIHKIPETNNTQPQIFIYSVTQRLDSLERVTKTGIKKDKKRIKPIPVIVHKMIKKQRRLVTNNASIFWINSSICYELKNKILTSYVSQSKSQYKKTRPKWSVPSI